jgi:hypothetical protein
MESRRHRGNILPSEIDFQAQTAGMQRAAYMNPIAGGCNLEASDEQTTGCSEGVPGQSDTAIIEIAQGRAAGPIGPN